MPIVSHSGYKAPLLLKNRHLLTVYPYLFRKIKPPSYNRKRIETPDEDFIDLDFSYAGSNKIVIILHGLEGSSNGKYVQGMVAIFNQGGYDTVSMNFRGCSGEPNKQLRSYHSGDTADLETVIRHIIALNKYQSIHFVGFSLGGNVLLKYIGERGTNIDGRIKSAVAISVPCDLKDSAAELEKKHNIVYMKRFIRNLEEKLQAKTKQYPLAIDLTDYKEIKTFRQFDERYTAPIHGFLNAEDYWAQSSSKQYLSAIRIPVLLINALDDPFLGKGCFPYKEAEQSEFFFLETPLCGGHVGFVRWDDAFYWSERRAYEFIHEHSAMAPKNKYRKICS